MSIKGIYSDYILSAVIAIFLDGWAVTFSTVTFGTRRNRHGGYHSAKRQEPDPSRRLTG